MPVARTCEECGRPFTPARARQRRCDAHEIRGRDGASPTTRAQDSEYAAERARVLVPGALCHWCGAPATTTDHVVPVARGGGHRGNLVPACERCNFCRQDDEAWRPPDRTPTPAAGARPTGLRLS